MFQNLAQYQYQSDQSWLPTFPFFAFLKIGKTSTLFQYYGAMPALSDYSEAQKVAPK